MGQLNVQFELRAGALLQDVANNDIAKKYEQRKHYRRTLHLPLKDQPRLPPFFYKATGKHRATADRNQTRKKEVATEKEVEQRPEIKPEKKKSRS